MRGRFRPLVFVKILVLACILFLGFGQAVLHLWNWLMPPIFGLREITYWQGMGLMGLSWLLFGGWRGPWGPSHHRRLDHLTPEQRERFLQGMRRHSCGPFHDRAAEEVAAAPVDKEH